MGNGQEQVSMTRDELQALIASEVRTAQMDPEERKVRGIVRDELRGALRETLPEVLGEIFDLGGEGEGGAQGGQKPGDAGKGGAGGGGLRSFLGIAGGEGKSA